MKSILTAAALFACTMGVAQAQEAKSDLLSVELSLGDVSLNKVAFLVAADNGINEKNGLKVRQFVYADAAS